jgi:hypothetical protein
MCLWSATPFQLLRRVSSLNAQLLSLVSTRLLLLYRCLKGPDKPKPNQPWRKRKSSSLILQNVYLNVAKPSELGKLGEETGGNDHILEDSTWQRTSWSPSRTYIYTSYFHSQRRLSSKTTVYSTFLYQIQLISVSHCGTTTMCFLSIALLNLTSHTLAQPDTANSNSLLCSYIQDCIRSWGECGGTRDMDPSCMYSSAINGITYVSPLPLLLSCGR